MGIGERWNGLALKKHQTNTNRILNIVVRTLAKYSNDFSQRSILVGKDLPYFFLPSNEHKNTNMPPNIEIYWPLQTTGAEIKHDFPTPLQRRQQRLIKFKNVSSAQKDCEHCSGRRQGVVMFLVFWHKVLFPNPGC